jgi:hypothetical protein
MVPSTTSGKPRAISRTVSKVVVTPLTFYVIAGQKLARYLEEAA